MEYSRMTSENTFKERTPFVGLLIGGAEKHTAGHGEIRMILESKIADDPCRWEGWQMKNAPNPPHSHHVSLQPQFGI